MYLDCVRVHSCKTIVLKHLNKMTSSAIRRTEVSFFSNFVCLSRNIFVCKFVYIFRTDENPFGSCQHVVIIYILRMMTTQQRIGLPVILMR